MVAVGLILGLRQGVSATSGARMTWVSSAPSARAADLASWNGSRLVRVTVPVATTLTPVSDRMPEGPLLVVLAKNAISMPLARARAREVPICVATAGSLSEALSFEA